MADNPANPHSHPQYHLITKMIWLAALILALAGLAAIKAGAAGESDFTADVVAGQKLFQRLGCQSCHALGDRGGDTGPALNGVGQRLSAADLEQQLTEPGRRHPQSQMPSFAFLRPAELSALINYLQTLK
ncbi:MAG: c-type cytochrome [Desulfobacteraceae bacterium]